MYRWHYVGTLADSIKMLHKAAAWCFESSPVDAFTGFRMDGCPASTSR